MHSYTSAPHLHHSIGRTSVCSSHVRVYYKTYTVRLRTTYYWRRKTLLRRKSWCQDISVERGGGKGRWGMGKCLVKRKSFTISTYIPTWVVSKRRFLANFQHLFVVLAVWKFNFYPQWKGDRPLRPSLVIRLSNIHTQNTHLPLY